jgi:hypothetical protein
LPVDVIPNLSHALTERDSREGNRGALVPVALRAHLAVRRAVRFVPGEA